MIKPRSLYGNPENTLNFFLDEFMSRILRNIQISSEVFNTIYLFKLSLPVFFKSRNGKKTTWHFYVFMRYY